MDTNIMISNIVPEGQSGSSNSAIYLWLGSIFWPDKYPPDKNDTKLTPWGTDDYYGKVMAKDQGGQHMQLYWHSDNYLRPTWIAFAKEMRHLLHDTENILFWDKEDFNKKTWSSNDNTGNVALKRYKKAVALMHEYHEAINRPNVRSTMNKV